MKPRLLRGAVRVLILPWLLLVAPAQGQSPEESLADRERIFLRDRDGEDSALAERLRLAHAWKQRRRTEQTSDHGAGYGPPSVRGPWRFIGPEHSAGRVKCLAVDPVEPKVVYAGAATGGVWKSTDGGVNWFPLWLQKTVNLSVGALAVAPSSRDVVYAGTGEWAGDLITSYPGVGVYRSDDGGKSWVLTDKDSPKGDRLESRRIGKIVVHPTQPRTVWVGGNKGLERSDNKGKTWNVLHAGQVTDIAMTKSGALIYARHDDALYLLDGKRRVRLENGPTGEKAAWLRVDIGPGKVGEGDVLYVRHHATLYRVPVSKVETREWAHHGQTPRRGVAEQHPWANLLRADPRTLGRVYSGTIGLYRSDGTWNAIKGILSDHVDHHDVAFVRRDDVRRALVALDAGVSVVGEKETVPSRRRLHITQIYDLAVSRRIGDAAERILFGTQDLDLLDLTFPGSTGDVTHVVIDPKDPALHWISSLTRSGSFVRADRRSAMGTTSEFGPFPMKQRPCPLAYHAGGRLVAGNRSLEWWDQAQRKWHPWPGAEGSQRISAVTAIDSREIAFWFGRAGRAFCCKEARRLRSCREVSDGLPGGRPLTDFDVHGGRTLVAVGRPPAPKKEQSVDDSPATVFELIRGRWKDIGAGLPYLPVNSVLVDRNRKDVLYAGTDLGVWRRVGDKVWELFDNGLPHARVADLEWSAQSGSLLAATYGRGLWSVFGNARKAAQPLPVAALRDHPHDPMLPPELLAWQDRDSFFLSPDIRVAAVADLGATPKDPFTGLRSGTISPNQPHRVFVRVTSPGRTTDPNVRVALYAAKAATTGPLPGSLRSYPKTLGPWRRLGSVRSTRLYEEGARVLAWDWTPESGAPWSFFAVAAPAAAELPKGELPSNIGPASPHLAFRSVHELAWDATGQVKGVPFLIEGLRTSEGGLEITLDVRGGRARLCGLLMGDAVWDARPFLTGFDTLAPPDWSPMGVASERVGTLTPDYMLLLRGSRGSVQVREFVGSTVPLVILVQSMTGRDDFAVDVRVRRGEELRGARFILRAR